MKIDSFNIYYSNEYVAFWLRCFFLHLKHLIFALVFSFSRDKKRNGCCDLIQFLKSNKTSSDIDFFSHVNHLAIL